MCIAIQTIISGTAAVMGLFIANFVSPLASVQENIVRAVTVEPSSPTMMGIPIKHIACTARVPVPPARTPTPA